MRMNRKERCFLVLWCAVVVLLVMRTAYEQKHPLVLQGERARFIAIASTGKDIQSPVAYLFGRAPYFIICDRLKRSYESVPNTYLDSQHAAGLRAAQMLAKLNVDAVCGNNIGFEPANVFGKANIEMYTNVQGTVWETLEAFPDALTKINKESVPAHFGITGSKNPIACTSFDAMANIEQIVQGRFMMCLDCGYRLPVGNGSGNVAATCAKCGGNMHEIVAVASPPVGGTRLRVRVL